MRRMIRQWQAEEVKQLLRYPVEGPVELARELGRSAAAVSSLANRLGMRSIFRRQRQRATCALRSTSRTAPDGVSPKEHAQLTGKTKKNTEGRSQRMPVSTT